MKKKFLAAFAICMSMMSTIVFAMEKANIDIFYYSRDMELKNDVYTENGSYFIPLRECAELLGAIVDYTKDKITLNFPYDYIEYYLNENQVMVGSVPNRGQVININGVSYVNARDFFSLLGNGVIEVDDSDKKVLIVQYGTIGIPTEAITMKKSNNNFNTSFSLLNAIPKNQNGVVCPISMKLSLAMVANGTTGQTQQQILNVLGYNTIEELNNFVSNEALKWTVEEKRTDENFKKQPNQGKIVFCNGLWYNSGEQKIDKNIFSESFQNIANTIFHSTANTVTNANALNIINEWGKQSTQGFLPQIIQDANFETALINTAYFKCCWNKEFKPENTKKAVFYNIDNSTSEIDFMNMSSSVNYCETEGWQMIELPYNDLNYNMCIFLPNKENHQSLNNEIINKLFTYCCHMDVEIAIPKIEIENNYDITETLKAMGLTSMYQNTEDFNNMFSDGVNRTITKTIQKTKITINESGTEAAATTQHLLAGHDGDITKPPVFQADRPFIYMITRNMSDDGIRNKEVLFIGQYVTGKL